MEADVADFVAVVGKAEVGVVIVADCVAVENSVAVVGNVNVAGDVAE